MIDPFIVYALIGIGLFICMKSLIEYLCYLQDEVHERKKREQKK